MYCSSKPSVGTILACWFSVSWLISEFLSRLRFSQPSSGTTFLRSSVSIVPRIHLLCSLLRSNRLLMSNFFVLFLVPFYQRLFLVFFCPTSSEIRALERANTWIGQQSELICTFNVQTTFVLTSLVDIQMYIRQVSTSLSNNVLELKYQKWANYSEKDL